MRLTRHKRQMFLFLVAILLPAAILIGLASRIMYQERELAAKRAADQRRAAVDQLRRELAARLEAIRLQEINQLMRSPNLDRAPDQQNPAVVFTARLEADRLVLPWEAAAQPGAPVSAEFARHRQDGEAQEFIKKDYAAAAAAYRLALSSSRHPSEGAEARLLLARALVRAGNTAEASRQYGVLLTEAAEARDEQGVGFCFYAAERLLEASRRLLARCRGSRQCLRQSRRGKNLSSGALCRSVV